jgi:hypothetical protein
VLPKLCGRGIEIRIRRSLGPHLASTFIRRRLILLDSAVLAQRGDFERILVHELFHFVWVRLPNKLRWDWERLLAAELKVRARGELGWSAERRKVKLSPADPKRRGTSWRLYACESFCDTAAWRFAGLTRHQEFTLAARFRRARRKWFAEQFSKCVVSI